MKVINGTNILLTGEIDISNTDKFISISEFEDRYSHFGINEGDLVVTSSGTLGKVGRIRAEHLPLMMNTSVIRFRSKDVAVLDDGYLYCYLRSPVFQAAIRSFAVGGAQQNFGPTHLKRISLDLPALAQQKKIAQAISFFDDLIDNNRRRMALLEQSARLLYREWFVHLRFPGHEHVKVVDGVPDGWEQKTIGEIAETIGGGTPSTAVPEYWDDGDITWFSPTDLTRNDCLALLGSAKKITDVGLKNSSAKMLPPETILMSSRASIGYFGLYDGAACTNQGFISLIPRNDGYRYYLLYNLLARREEIESKARGTTFKEINKTTFRAMQIIWPDHGLATEFSEFAGAVMKQVRTLKQQSEKLREARDLLLPRLMRGEIEV